MKLYQALTRRGGQTNDGEQSARGFSLDSYLAQLNLFGGGVPSGTLTQNGNEIGSDYRGVIEGAYKANGVVFACMLSRMLLFSEARFRFRQEVNGRPGDLFGSTALKPLEQPWHGATTGDLLSRMIQDADLGGNAFVRQAPGNTLERLNPQWTTIVAGHPVRDALPGALGTEILGYVYEPPGVEPVKLLREQVAHFAPIPDPSATFRGMSWLTPIIREVQADRAATVHKQMFFENGATPNMIVSFDREMRPEQVRRFKELFDEGHSGVSNAYETMFLGGGANAEVVGSDLKQIDFKVTQGHGETRIAAAAGVPPIIVGLSEGLDSATYSNYAQARRRFADMTMRPLWRNAAGSLATILDGIPPGAELWYDDRDIPALQEDLKDEAEIQQTQANAIRALVDAGFEPDSVVSAVTAADLNRLKHSGLYSVQLQAPGANDGEDPPPAGAPALPAPKPGTPPTGAAALPPGT